MSEFVEAAQNGNLFEVQRLFNLNPGVINEKDREKDTAIMKACRNCNAIDVVSFLLEKGANINDRDTIDQTPLIIASQNGCKDIVLVLLDVGADIHHKNDQGENALISAAQEGHIDVVKVLLGAGADVNESNSDGETPLSLVIKLKQKKELIELLREKTNGAMGIRKKVKRKNWKSKKTKKKRKIVNKKRKSMIRK